MGAFITEDDYGSAIQDNVLDAVTDLSDDFNIEVVEDQAVEEMKGYLNNRYVVNDIFNKTGDARNPIILMYAIDMALYHMHRISNQRKIPSMRQKRYEMAIQWLEKVSAGEINPPDLPVPDAGEKDYVLMGSNPRRDNQY